MNSDSSLFLSHSAHAHTPHTLSLSLTSSCASLFVDEKNSSSGKSKEREDQRAQAFLCVYQVYIMVYIFLLK